MSKLRYAAISAIGTGGVVTNVVRADQADLLTRPEGDQQVAPARLGGGQRLGHREHGGRARRVVVGAVVHLANLFLRGQRAAGASVAEMIVVRADHHPRLLHVRAGGRGGQVGHHVVPGLAFALDRGLHRERQVGHRESGHVGVAAVELLLHVLERLVRHGGEDGLGHRAAGAGGDQARAGQGGVERHRHHLAGVGRSRSGDHHQRLRAALARRLCLVAQVGVARERGPRLGVGVFREVAKHDDDLVLDVEALVAVVAEVLGVGHHQSVAGYHHRSAHLGVVRERERLHLGRVRRSCAAPRPCGRR
jgi:hypothetical protein